jgi:threonine dehydratase
MISITQIQSARRAIQERVHRTPVLSSRSIGERCGASVYLKAEALQKTGSFKVRGVLNKLQLLTAEQRKRGLVTVSAGNHAQALAYGAAAEGLRATVVMPESAQRSKVQASRDYGAEVLLHGDTFAAFAKALELRDTQGLTLIHPFDDPAIMAGQGTLALELLEDLPDVDVVVVPVGGGGLISGVAAAIKALRPQAKVYGVEPVGSAACTAGLTAGHPTRLEQITTIADGLTAPITGELVLEHLRAFVDDIILVEDADIEVAMRVITQRAKLVVEPAGATAAAALVSGKLKVPPRSRVAVIASGGNVDLRVLARVFNAEPDA